jgi:hypothetical protein
MKEARAMKLGMLVLPAALALALSAATAQGAEEKIDPITTDGPVVVELFTSQGCSSCPPADAYLGDLARRRDVLALALHVDYWDYIGWKDRFASPAATQRQHAYARALRQRMVYTPQMVVDGAQEAVGSNRGEVEALIAAARARPKLPIAFSRDSTGLDWVEVGDGPRPASGSATVYIALYDGRHETPVDRGENAGATLTEFNVVRELKPIGRWTGKKLRLPIEVDETDEAYEACAVIVQEDDVGPILGAAAMKMRKK